MKRALVVFLVMALLPVVATAQLTRSTTTLQFTGTTGAGLATGLWWGGQNANNASSNEGGGTDAGVCVFTLPAVDWYFPAILYKADMPAGASGMLITSATFRVADNWWHTASGEDNGYSNVELHRIGTGTNTPIAWQQGDGLASNRWGASDNGAARYFATYDNLALGGTTWKGVYELAANWNWKDADDEFLTGGMGELISTADVHGSMVASGTDPLAPGDVPGARRGGEFDMRLLVQNWVDGIWSNDGFCLWSGNSANLNPTADNINTMQLSAKGLWWSPDGTTSVPLGLTITYQARLPGDANNDTLVDQSDYVIWYNHYGITTGTWRDGDFDGGGLVDQTDYIVWYNGYGSTAGSPSPTPEPMTLVLLAIGAGLLRRRR